MSAESLLAHLEALRKMILEILAIFILLLIPGWYFAPEALELLQSAADHLAENSGLEEKFELRYFALMEPFVVELKAGMCIAFAAGLPLYFWRLWKFLAPALYRHEKRIFSAAAVSAWVLFCSGFALGIFGVMPLLVKFSLSFAREGLTPMIGLNNFIALMMNVALAFGVMFELPLILLALVMAGVISLDTLKKQRPLAIVIIVILAAVLTPPDVVSQLMLAIPTYLLFELTLLAGSLWLKKSEAAESIANEAVIPGETSAAEEAAELESSDSQEVMRCYYRKRKRRTVGALPRRKNRI